MLKLILALVMVFHLATAIAVEAPYNSASSSVVVSPVIHQEVAVLRAQLETIKQFHDSFISMALWSLSGVIAVALALGAFAWFTNKTNYDRDREAIHREAKALAIELRAEVQTQVQSESKKIMDALADREKAVKESVERTLSQKLSALSTRLSRIESDTLDLKEAALEQEADEAVKSGSHRWAVRQYCELLKVHVTRGTDAYYAGEILDKLRAIAKDPKATLDADTVTLVAKELGDLPKQQQTACEPLISLFKARLA